MTEIDDLSARLSALETVVRQLLTHLAVHAEDPPRWAATRRVLALHAMNDDPSLAADPHARAEMESAITGFFGRMEDVVEAYGEHSAHPRVEADRLNRAREQGS